MTNDPIQQAAEAVAGADAVLIGAGAGMGVDSGLPDFRGPEGFWKAYPPFRGRQFSSLSTPHWFQTDPGLAWGFFGHRLNRYRAALPHRDGPGGTEAAHGADRAGTGGDALPAGAGQPGGGGEGGADLDDIGGARASSHGGRGRVAAGS